MEHNVQGRQVYLLNGPWQRLDKRNLQQETLAEGSKVWLPDTFVPHDLGKLYPLDSHRVVLGQGELISSSPTPPGCTPITLVRMALKMQERPKKIHHF